MEQESLRNYTRFLLAAAVTELFPQTHFLGGRATDHGFYCDLTFPFAFQDHMLLQIEEKMRQLNLEFRLFEMVPKSAAAYLEHRGFSKRAEQARLCLEPLLQMAEAGGFVDFFEGEFGDRPGSFKLLELVSYPGFTRLLGTAFTEKAELKAFVKAWEPVKGRRFEDINAELAFISGSLWLPKGESIRTLLIDLWRKEVVKENFHIISTHAQNLQEMDLLHKQTGLARTAEVASCGGFFIDQIYSRGGNLEVERISSLLFIEKILKILLFDFKVVSPSKNLFEFHLKDVFGVWERGPYVKVDKDRKVVVRSVFAPLERFFALLVEKGALPLSLASEQVRVLAIDSDSGVELIRRLRRAGVRATLENTEGDLKKRVYDALRERVPFSIVLGNREKETGILSVRAYGSEKVEQMTIETLIGRLTEFENQ